MEQKKMYQELASKINARINCIERGNAEWVDNHEFRIDYLMRNTSPSGSGIDCGTTIDYEKSTGNKLVFYTSFHHMNENGMYDGWTKHTVTVTPSLFLDFDVKISGRNRNEIKDCLAEIYYTWLNEGLTEEQLGMQS